MLVPEVSRALRVWDSEGGEVGSFRTGGEVSVLLGGEGKVLVGVCGNAVRVWDSESLVMEAESNGGGGANSYNAGDISGSGFQAHPKGHVGPVLSLIALEGPSKGELGFLSGGGYPDYHMMKWTSDGHFETCFKGTCF